MAQLTLEADFTCKICGKIARVTLLQIRALPIFTGQSFSAIRRAAVAFDPIIIVVGHGPIMRELFTSANIAHGDKRVLASQPEVWIAGMI